MIDAAGLRCRSTTVFSRGVCAAKFREAGAYDDENISKDAANNF